jgi:hypothetical protein
MPNKLKKSKKSKTPLEEAEEAEEFFCLCCKEKVKAKPKTICVDMYKNKRYALRGTCPKNKCKLSKIISNENAIKLKKKYGDCPKDDNSSGNKAAEVGGIFALFALLGGAIAYAVKNAKKC